MSTKIIPVPASEAPVRGKKGRNAKYPFDSLEVGGCFPVPEGKLPTLRNSVSQRNIRERLKAGEDGVPKVFTVAKDIDGNYFVWRDA